MNSRTLHFPTLICLAALLAACGGAGGGGQALVGVTVVDGLGNPPMPDRVVVIRDGRIAEVAAAAGYAAPRGTQAIDLSGRFVLPGLVDVHAHVAILAPAGEGSASEVDLAACHQVLETLLAFGVTTVRDPGAPAAPGVALREAVRKGEVLGPRIVTAEADLPEGVGKGYRGLPRDQVAWLETIDLDGPEISEMIALLAEQQIPVDPTLVALHAKFFGDDPSVTENPELHLAPAVSVDAWREGTFVDDWSADDFARARQAWPRVLELTKKLYDAGVPLAAGSDLPNPWVIPGVSLHRELRLLNDAGIAPLEVLRIATSGGAAALGLEAEIGSVEPGKVADLIVLAADPTKSLINTRAISHVFVGGRFLDPAALLE